MCNFDPNPRGRNEARKNKWTPHYHTEFDGETVLCPENFYSEQIRLLKKNDS
jgi:hypothetical protein